MAGKQQPIIVVLLGPPGGGKGTQAKRLAEAYGLVHYSTGEILREEVRCDTETGRRVRAVMEAGELVPDELMGRIVRSRLEAVRGDGCILDGYPRNLHQARFLDGARGGMPLLVLNIAVSEDQLVRRLSGRRLCPRCGKLYNVYFSPPREAERCDLCGVGLQRRKDDEESVIQERLRVYAEETHPVVEYYRDRETYFEVDGNAGADQVFAGISGLVGAFSA
jgi:adenylate kinase